MSKTVSLGARISLIDRMSSGLNKVVGSLGQATKASEKMDAGVKKMASATTSAASQTSSAMSKVESATSKASKSTKQMGEAAQQATGKVIPLEEAQKRAAKAAELAAQKTEKLRKEYAGLSAETANVLSKVDKASGAFQATGAAMTVGGAAITAGLTKSVQTTMQFDDAMSSVKAKTGSAGKAFENLRNEAIRLGATTSFSATDAANAMDKLAMAGWKNDQIMKGTGAMLNLAAAGALDLASAADIASDIMTPFQISADEAGRVSDVLAKAATSANTDVRLLGETMKYTAPIAAQYGMSLEQTSAIAAKMADAGIKGSEAGTAMRAALTRLASPPKEAANALDALGISTTDASGNMRDIYDVIGDMDLAFGKLSESQRLAAAKNIFGMEAMSGWLSVLGTGKGTLTEFTGALENSSGYAQEVAETMNDNIGGAFRELGSAAESAMINIGDELKGGVRKVADFTTGLISKFNGLDPFFKKIVAWGSVGAAGFLLLAGPLLLLIGFLPSIVSGFGFMATALGMTSGALLGAVGAAFGWIAAIAGIGIALVVAYKKSETFREIVNKAFSAVKKVVENVVEVIKALAKDVFAQVANWWNKDGQMIKQAVSNVVSFLISAWQKVSPALSIVFRILGVIVKSIWTNIKNVITSGIGIITSVINIFSAIFTGNWSALWTNVKSLLKNALVFAWNLVQLTFLGKLLGPIRAGIGIIKSILLAGWNFIKGIFTKSLSGIVGIVRINFNFIMAAVKAGMALIRMVISVAWNFIKGVFLAGLNFIRGRWSAGWQFIKSTFVSIFNVVKNVLVTGFNFMKEKATWFFDKLKSLINTAKTKFGEFKTKVSEVIEFFKSALSNAGEKVTNFFSPLIGFIDSAKEKWGDFKSAISNFKMPSFKMPSWLGGGKSGKEDGRAYTGLRRVPFDGYKAVLHRDETVLNANEANLYRRYGLNNPSQQTPVERSKPASFGGSKPSTVANTTSNKSEALVKIDIGGVTIAASEIDAMSKDDARFKETAEKLLDYLADRLDDVARNTPDVTREALL